MTRRLALACALLALTPGIAACDDSDDDAAKTGTSTVPLATASPSVVTPETAVTGTPEATSVRHAAAPPSVVAEGTAVAATPESTSQAAPAPTRDVPLGSEPPPFSPEDLAAMNKIEEASPTEEDVPQGFVSVRAEFRPNYVILERLGDPEAGRQLILETGRLNGYFVQFDGVQANALQIVGYIDLFVDAQGASVALRRAPEFQNVTDYQARDAPLLGDESAAFHFVFPQQGAEGYELAARVGRVVLTVSVYYRTNEGTLDEAIPLVQTLLSRLGEFAEGD